MLHPIKCEKLSKICRQYRTRINSNSVRPWSTCIGTRSRTMRPRHADRKDDDTDDDDDHDDDDDDDDDDVDALSLVLPKAKP